MSKINPVCPYCKSESLRPHCQPTEDENVNIGKHPTCDLWLCQSCSSFFTRNYKRGADCRPKEKR